MTITQQWKDTVNGGIADARWDEYDEQIKKEIDVGLTQNRLQISQ